MNDTLLTGGQNISPFTLRRVSQRSSFSTKKGTSLQSMAEGTRAPARTGLVPYWPRDLRGKSQHQPQTWPLAGWPVPELTRVQGPLGHVNLRGGPGYRLQTTTPVLAKTQSAVERDTGARCRAAPVGPRAQPAASGSRALQGAPGVAPPDALDCASVSVAHVTQLSTR